MNCKPGDMAYVASVDDERMAENVGHVVTVLKFAGAEDYWHIEATAPGLIGYRDGNFFRLTNGLIRDRNLRPITPPAPEQLRIEETFDPMFVALGIHSRTYA